MKIAVFDVGNVMEGNIPVELHRASKSLIVDAGSAYVKGSMDLVYKEERH
jgi:hypothetical protein